MILERYNLMQISTLLTPVLCFFFVAVSSIVCVFVITFESLRNSSFFRLKAFLCEFDGIENVEEGQKELR